MSVSLHIGRNSFEIGSASFFHCFFSTIAVHLEDENWGSRYPVIMRDLYSGELDHRKASEARSELLDIRERLKGFDPTQVIWDYENRKANPPWGNEISNHITSLSNYFVTSDGKDLFEVMFKALETSGRKKQNMTIM